MKSGALLARIAVAPGKNLKPNFGTLQTLPRRKPQKSWIFWQRHKMWCKNGFWPPALIWEAT